MVNGPDVWGDDLWDTGQRSKRDQEIIDSSMRTVAPSSSPGPVWDTGRDRIHDMQLKARRMRESAKQQRREPSVGRRVRKMSKEFSIPVLPIILFLIWDPLGFFDDDEDKQVKDTTSNTEIVEQVKEVANDTVTRTLNVVEKAKKQYLDDKSVPFGPPKHKAASNGNESGDPFDYDTDDLYGNTESKY